ncbi:cysteine proteinase inhibitor 5-like [Vicia villosa]|uniref:cysteine proteinase inhibitor 5-like n=1 Tax=Vicia villosa TaxID=3911 RepID=UPI00273CC8D5|nr:cysteine proteinase inhibitor 5-like [Vicia villosa]
MKFQSSIILSFLVVILAYAATNHANPININDSYVTEFSNFAVDPINVDDPYVIEIANFAINEYNKGVSVNKLKLEKVLFAVSYKKIEGTKYQLAISATHDSVSMVYNVKVAASAEVLDDPEHHNRALVSFIFP